MLRVTFDWNSYPNENTIWRMDVINNVSSYITNVYPPVSGDGRGYGENFSNKIIFS
jgi:hypothetical protein